MKILLLMLVALCAGVMIARVDQMSPSATGVVPAAMAAEPQTRGPDLGVSIIRAGDDFRPLVAPGQQINLEVGISNLNGDSDAHSVVLTVKLPSGLMLQSASPTPNKVEGPSLVWNLGTVAAHAFPQTFDLNLVVANDAPSELTVSVGATSSEREQYTENNNVSLPIIVKPAAADLIVQSTLGTVALTYGKPVMFSASVINQGNITASAILLSVVLPPKMSFKSGDPPPTATSGDTLKWQLGDIAPGASRTVAVTVTLDTSLAATAADQENLLKFQFDASTASTQVNPANNHLEIQKHVVRAGSDLKVWLSVQGAETPGELPVGKDVTYTITYGNFGNAPAQQASVSLSLSQGLNLSRAAPPPTGTSKNDRFVGGVLSWNIGDLAVGQSNIIKSQIHVASVPEDGSLVMATISAPGPSVNSGDNVAYSLRQAPRTAGQHGAAAQSGHLFRWLSLLAVLLIVILWAAFRARRRPASA
jgi:uncharacterized repeat protein (TIGR01451 family)